MDDEEPAGGPRCFTVVTGAQAMDAWKNEWERLAAATGLPMQSYDWVRTAADVFASHGEPHVFVAGAPRAVAIAPLIRTRTFPSRLEFIGSALSEPSDFLFSGEQDLHNLTRELARSGVPLFLKRVFADSPLVQALETAYSVGLIVCRDAGACPWIPLDDTWAEPERHLNSGRCSDLRRMRKMAEKMGPVTSEVLSPEAGELDSLLREAYDVEAQSWKGREGSALKVSELHGAFFRRFAAASCAAGTLRMCFLRIGGEAAAMQIAIESGGRFSLLKIGYSDRFGRCSPGMLLMAETIRYAARRGLKSYEFLGTANTWTQVWTPLERRCVSVRAYPAATRGLARLAADSASAGWNHLGAALEGTWVSALLHLPHGSA